MITVRVRCYAELNDALPPSRRQRQFTQTVDAPETVGMLVTALGISEGAIDLVLVNGESSAMNCRLSGGEAVSLFPVFESFDIRHLTKLRDQPLRRPSFVVDVHLGKLANHLRMLGFDSAFDKFADDDRLMQISQEENRTLLSKDRALLAREEITRKYCVRHIDPRMQLIEVLDRFDLRGSVVPFTRCIECNALLVKIAKEDVIDRLPEKVRVLFHEFQWCPDCNRVYWKGSHHERMRSFIDEVLAG